MTSHKDLINIQRQRKDTTENDENSDSDVDSDDSIELEFSLEALKESAERIFEDKCKVITQIVEIMCELKKHKFPKIGGIFIDPDTQEFTVAAIKKEIKYIKTAHTQEKQEKWTPVYEILAELVPNFFSKDDKERFVPTHIAAIKKEIKYIKTAHTQEKQEKWTPVYEILAELVPNFFSKDDKERFVPTHGDLHPTNIVMEGTKITGNPFASTTEEEIKEHEELQKFFREQMKNFDPEFVGIMDNMDEFKSKIYNLFSECNFSASIEQKKPSQQQKQQLLLISTITTTTKHLGNNKLLATTTTTANYSLPPSTITSRSSSPFAQFAILPTFNSTIINPTPTIINNNNDNDNNDNNNDNNDDDNDNDYNNNSNNSNNRINAINLNQGKKSIQDILNKSHRTEREVKFTLSKLRRLILDEGIPEENLPKLSPSIQNLIRPDSLRSTVWKRLLGVYHVSASDYVRLIKKGKSCVYEKIRSDTFRTMATDQKFLERVNEEMLTRLLNATAWKMKVSGNQSISYVQGMNVLAAPFLYTMSELDAYCSFVTFIQTCCPLYVTPNLQGLLEKCLKILDVKLFNYLKSKNLTAIIYALPSVLTFCACTPSLDELLKLWDFLFAYGVHLNILCIIAQLVLIRDQLLEAPSPMKLLRTMPKLDAKSIINLTVEFVQKIPNDLYDLLVRHPFDSTVESLVID
ncbi:7237_t:CDS:10 [Entrophospora sp. SA101]|nr:7237_t:CDS:10 [Entrophospora sp. SA101]